nr:hypothetical protein [Tanacetum cinerariifolium]
MEMWSGHPSDYGMLRIFDCVPYPHDNQGKLEMRAVNYVLLEYPEGVKGLAFFLGKTLPVSKLGCVLCQDFVAFCLEDFLHFVLRPLCFVSRLSCVLSQDLLLFVSRLTAFCLQSVAFCLQASCVLSTVEDFFLSFDIQCAGSDTRPPMLDRTNFASWQQRIRLYCRGKKSGVNILMSIDEGPYRMGTVRETLAESTEEAPQFGPERPRVYSDLSPNEKDRFVTAVKLNRGLRDSNYDQLYAYLKQHETHAKENKMMLERFSQPTLDHLALMNQAIVQDGRVVVQNVQGRQNKVQGMNPRGGGAAGYGGAQNRVGNVTQGQARLVKCYNYNALDEEQLLFLAGGQDNAFDDDVDEQPVQDLALNVDNVFQADDCDTFDSNVDEAPTAQTMFMANLSSADPVTYEAGPSYDSDILSEVQDHDHYQDAICAHHEEHTMHDSVQLDHVVDSHTDYTSDSNMILYDQPKPYYNELNKVAIGYKNPLCLTRTKQVQPDLYNGYEIIKDNHAPAIVHNTKDNLEIAKITRKKMNAKMNDPECVTRKSNDLIKLKSKALKEQTTVSRPIKALTVYPPNTPATLVPRVLPTKSQVKIYIFTLIQLFLEFDKTCKKRITPTGLTEGEMGFEQTKECYLKDVIPFFKTLKDNFEGIQKALINEIKEMKDVFEELEAEVAQSAVDRKHDAIERKNLLIENDNLIAKCLSKEVFSVKGKQEKDKIGTKPDQIEIKREAWKSPAMPKSSHN